MIVDIQEKQQGKMKNNPLPQPNNYFNLKYK